MIYVCVSDAKAKTDMLVSNSEGINEGNKINFGEEWLEEYL